MSADKIAEEKSANPGKDWHHPSGPHDGLTDSMANAPQSGLGKSSTQGTSSSTNTDTDSGKEQGESAGMIDNVQKNAYENVHSL